MPSVTPDKKPKAAPAAFTNLEVRPTFTTPLAVARVASGPALNAALKPLILEREKIDRGLKVSNVGGWHSQTDFQTWSGPAGARLLQLGVALANRLTKARDGRGVKVPWKISAWANVNRRGDSNSSHTHPGNFWSGAYFVDDAGAAQDKTLGGEFEIFDPRGAAPAMYSPGLVFNVPNGNEVGAQIALLPQAGTMLLFPSWLTHGVKPYLGEGTRISVAFNLAV